MACQNNAPLDVIKLLIEKGVGVNARNKVSCFMDILLYPCIIENKLKRVARWIDNLFNNTQFGRAPLHWACNNSEPLEIVNLLIDSGADVNAVDDVSPNKEAYINGLHYRARANIHAE